jgi:hypothetical protein
MKTVNIDELPPTELTKLLERPAYPWEGEKFRRVTCHQRNYYRSALGINAAKLFDWRRLEKRSVELHDVAARYHKMFWSALQQLYDIATKDNAKEVWIVEPGGENVRTFDGKGLGSSDVNRLIELTTPNPQRRALVVEGSDAAALLKLDARARTWWSRGAVYVQAFRTAVECRVRPFIDEVTGTTKNNRSYFCPIIFVVENEGRSYVITVDANEGLKWVEGTVYACV